LIVSRRQARRLPHKTAMMRVALWGRRLACQVVRRETRNDMMTGSSFEPSQNVIPSERNEPRDLR